MGMYDTVHSSYNLGEQFTDVELQTKDIEDGIGGTMTNYWLSPDGVLYHIDYSGTADFEKIEEGEKDYNERLGFLNFRWVPNGNRGKITPCYITRYVEVYPSGWKGQWEDWPRCRLHFRCGKLLDYEDVTG